LKNIKFNPFSFFLKTYLIYLMPMAFLVTIMLCLYPFIGYGPIYSYLAYEFYTQPCQKYWWTSFIFINNYYPYADGDPYSGGG